MAIKILTENQLRECVTLDVTAIDVVADAFTGLARGQAIMPPILNMEIPRRHAEVDIKTAYMRAFDLFAVKISSGFFENADKGLPSLSGLMVLFTADTGQPAAVLLDNGYLTDLRTAAAGAVAARELSRQDTKVAGVIGTGLQARLQIRALALVRKLNKVLVWGRHAEHAERCAQELRDALGIDVNVAGSAEAVVHESDVVVTTTPAKAPLIQAEWLHPGLHITAMGSDSPGKNELDPNILLRADRFIVDRRSQSVNQGEMRAAIAAGVIGEDTVVDELGELTAGDKPGREDDSQITVVDLTGTGAQDTAIANYALERAQARNFGHEIDN